MISVAGEYNQRDSSVVPDAAKRSHRWRRRMMLFGTLLILAAIFCGWVYRAKTHRDLNRQLFVAVENRDAVTAKSLLARGADPNIRDLPEQHLTLWDHVQSAYHRLRLSPEQRQRWETDNANDRMPTILEIAIDPYYGSDGNSVDEPRSENLPLVKAILEADARVNETDRDHITPLMEAVVFDRVQTVRLLLDHDANPLARNDAGQLPIHIAHSLKMVELLVRQGNDVNATDDEGSTPLMTVTVKDDAETVRFLISQGAKINVRAKDGTTPLIMAAQYDDVEAMGLLLDHGAEVNMHDNDGGTPLHYAADLGTVRSVRMLLAHGARVDPVDSNGDTPLTTCLASDEYRDVVQELVVHGADVNHRNKAGDTPLSIAKKSKYSAIVKLLEAAGAKP